MILTTRLVRTVAGVATTALLVGGAAVGVTVGVAQSAQAADPTTTPAIPCGAILDRLPADLKADVLALRDLPADQRFAAAMEIRQGVRSGEYGKRVQRIAKHRAAIAAAIFAKLPTDLQTDLTAAKGLPDDQKPAAYQAISAKALAGDYGTKVQTFAQKIQDRRALCGG